MTRSLKITPTLINIDEFTSASTSFTLSEIDVAIDDLTVYNWKFFSVSGEINKYSPYNVTNATDTSFTINATISDVFDRVIGYVDHYKSYTSTRFSDIPETYDAVYKYIASPEQYTSIYLTANCYYGMGAITAETLPNTTIQIEYYVRQNWQKANQFFQTALAGGRFGALARSKGYNE